MIVLTNLQTGDPGRISAGIAGLYEAALAPEEHKIVQVDPKLYDAYVGGYQLAPETVLTITADGGKLWGQAKGPRRLELSPESETTFYLDDVDAQITFFKDPDGKVTHLVLRQQGHETVAKKIK